MEDSSSTCYLEEDLVSLNNHDVLDQCKVAVQWVLEGDIVLALNHEAADVKGSELYPCEVVGLIVTATSEMIQTGRNVHDQVTVDKHLQLADTVVEIIRVESAEGEQHP